MVGGLDKGLRSLEESQGTKEERLDWDTEESAYCATKDGPWCFSCVPLVKIALLPPVADVPAPFLDHPN